jgi:GT2 family glycosyltransferase
MLRYKKTISSILEQTSSNWRVYVQADVTDYFNDDTRFALSLPSANTLGHNDFITHINAGDHLPIYAVEEALHAFTQANDIGVIYTDSDCDNAQGQRTEPWFKPSWDLELFLSQDYIQHLCVIRAPFVTEIDWSPYTFIWGGISNAINNKFTIKHLPLVLYHYGIESKSKRETTPLDIAHKYAQLLSPKVQLKQHPKYNYLRQVRFPIPDSPPLVSIIIPTKDHEQLLKACISSIENNTDYTSFELIIIDNQTTDKAALEFLTDCEMKGHKVIRYNKTFNYSAINNLAIQQANGELIALLNNDIEVISSNWLCELVSLLHRPNVGAAGAKLIWPNELVQHGGVVLGINQLANHIGNHDHMDSAGYHGMLQSTHRTDAVTAACLLTRKSDYLKVGGLDEKLFPVAFNDVDYCLKLAEINLDCIWSPNAQLFHVESITRGKDDIPSKRARSEMEMQNLRNNWSDQLLKDKYYHPALSLNHLNAPYEALAYPPRERKLR